MAVGSAHPAAEGRPPFLLVVDVGNVIEVYAEFSRSGATYTPFPDPRSHRLSLANLASADVRSTLRRIWLDPDSLDPSRASARVTRQVATQLAGLARSLEGSGHTPGHVAAFLTRALFSMFAEDVDLLPKGSFLNLLQTHRAQPVTLQQMLRVLWADMDRGGFSAALATQVLRFNGKLFKQTHSDGYSLLLNPQQIDGLILAANSNWREVEPAIFGTLLERALDPACGSGNFLYVTLEHLKRLEGEVMNQLEALGQTQALLGLEGETVTPRQLLGIELNERAAAMAELVLWIGYLQWHIRSRCNKAVAEPVVHDYGNIERRDAVLAWDDLTLAHDEHGQPLSRWDGRTFKTHPVTGALVPDEAALVPQWKYSQQRQAPWPEADYIVGNPPFIGASTMRAALGDGYVQALRVAWPEVPESADFVMHWWSRAAALVASGSARQFGLITTNSLRQTFNRRVVQTALGQGVTLAMAIPDHPWVDSANGAAVRIAMTVGMPDTLASARLLTVSHEQTGEFGEVSVTLAETSGLIHADLSVGANVASAGALLANANISSPGVKLHGAGFIVTPDEARLLLPPPLGEGGGGGQQPPHGILRDYRNGRDLTAAQVREQFPAI